MATHDCMDKETVSGHNRDPPRDVGEQGDRANFFRRTMAKIIRKKRGGGGRQYWDIGNIREDFTIGWSLKLH